MFELDPRLNNDTVTLGQFGLSQVLLMNDKRYPWCILVPQVADITEAYQLSQGQQAALSEESNAVAKALMELFDGDSLNVAALGNVVAQLHVHHVVRFCEDHTWPGPVWGVGQPISYSSQELARRVDEITQKLAMLDGFVAA